METIIEYLKRNLRTAGPKRWPAIAAQVNAALSSDDRVSESFMRKLAYGDRENPGVKNVQPLLDYFQAIDLGGFVLPPEPADAAVSSVAQTVQVHGSSLQPTTEPAQAGV